MKRYRVKQARLRGLAALAPPGIVSPGVLVLAALTLALPLHAQQPARTWCVTAMDDDHKPVTGLGKEDFALKDGGARQPVISVEPATGPIVVSLVTWGAPSATEFSAFDVALKAASPASAVVGHTRVSAARPQVRNSLEPIIEEAATNLRLAGTRQGFERRSLVFVAMAPIPFDQLDPPALSQTLQREEVPLWTVELQSTPVPRTRTDDALDAAVAAGGGLRWRVKTGDELADAAAGVAALLGTAQYYVTANLPSIFTPPAPIATRHDRGIVLVPMWPR